MKYTFHFFQSLFLFSSSSIFRKPIRVTGRLTDKVKLDNFFLVDFHSFMLCLVSFPRRGERTSLFTLRCQVHVVIDSIVLKFVNSNRSCSFVKIISHFFEKKSTVPFLLFYILSTWYLCFIILSLCKCPKLFEIATNKSSLDAHSQLFIFPKLLGIL